MQVAEHHSLLELQRLVRRQTDARPLLRLQMVLLARQSRTAPQIAEQHPGKNIQVWFQDEARFGQQGTLTRKWARRGSPPPAVKQTQYDWLWVLGTVCPATGQTVGLLSPQLNTAMINRFLQQYVP